MDFGSSGGECRNRSLSASPSWGRNGQSSVKRGLHRMRADVSLVLVDRLEQMPT
jgi:hypothetical protein